MPSFEVSVLERCPYREVQLYMVMLIKCHVNCIWVLDKTLTPSPGTTHMDYPKMDYVAEV